MKIVARFLVAVVCIAQSLPVFAACNTTCRPARNSKTGLEGTVTISLPTGLSAADAGAFMDGIEMWTDFLSSAGLGFNFNVMHSGTGDIQLVIDQSNLSGGAENATGTSGLGQIKFSTKYLNQNRTSYWRHIVAHELGHSIGFDNNWGSGCETQTIMFGSISAGGPFMTSLGDCDEAATQSRYTPPPTYTKGCTSCWTSCDAEGYCPPPPITTPSGGGTSPILVDLDGNGFHLTSLKDAVPFDLDADGRLETTTWTAEASQDAFLALDRNANGVIDDGTELFGNATRLRNGSIAEHGYVALAELDSNGDALVDHNDAAANRLLLWTDANHDGISQPAELQSLAAAGILSFETRFKVSNRQDPHGNTFRYRAHAMITNPSGHARRTMTYDVFFVVR